MNRRQRARSGESESGGVVERGEWVVQEREVRCVRKAVIVAAEAVGGGSHHAAPAVSGGGRGERGNREG